MLAVADLHVSYGKANVLSGVDLVCDPGTITAVIGPNGAGKSTLVRAIAGLVPSHRGSVVLGDKPLTGGDPSRVAAAGVRLVPQGRALFGSLSVAENLRMGAFLEARGRYWSDRVDQLAPLFPEVVEHMHRPANQLSGGQQQLVAVMRGLMCEFRVLMLDEPSLGVAPIVVERLAQILRDLLRAHPQTIILLVEQNLGLVTAVADDIAVLARGRNQTLLKPQEVRGAGGQHKLKELFFG